MKRIALFLSLLLVLGASAAFGSDDLRMDKETLKSMLGSPDLVILDVRAGKDWGSSELKIQDAIRAAGKDFDTWSTQYSKDKTLVLYCA